MIAILDYGVGNVSSIGNMLKRVGVQSAITSDAELIANADKLILPGVGHFDYCMTRFNAAPFYDLVQKRVTEEKVPVLGICVGCQMLLEGSEEGNTKGMGWLKGKVVKFKKEQLPANFKIPHMGWNEVQPRNTGILYDGLKEPRFYFVHSYYLMCEDPIVVSGTSKYGYEFTASVHKDNIAGVQFHPEKSHRFGMQLLKNFADNL